jgi:diguanylate cyclase (GGDEF)-like protein
MRDPLTGARSRAEWPDLVQKASSNAAGGTRGAWVALVDIDHFKRFNMHNGHVAGDEVLVKLAGFLLSLESDEGVQVVRTGGEEFALVSFAETDAGDDDGRAISERVLQWARDSLTPEQPKHCGDPGCVGPTRLTVSIALGRLEAGESATSLSERLTATMWEAKRTGRDRIKPG